MPPQPPGQADAGKAEQRQQAFQVFQTNGKTPASLRRLLLPGRGGPIPEGRHVVHFGGDFVGRAENVWTPLSLSSIIS